jgi:hypothetical protein
MRREKKASALRYPDTVIPDVFLLSGQHKPTYALAFIIVSVCLRYCSVFPFIPTPPYEWRCATFGNAMCKWRTTVILHLLHRRLVSVCVKKLQRRSAPLRPEARVGTREMNLT